MRFTHLHVHSHYSLLDGLAKIDELVKRAADLGFEALALTDHGVLYGAIEFYQKAKRQGIKPIIGLEAYLASGDMRSKQPGIDDKRFHLTLLAKNYIGYQNLIQLSTRAHLEGFYYKPRIDKTLLREHAAGLIALSGCLNGEIPQAILSKKTDRARGLIREYQEIFGKEHFYLELGAHPNIPEQQIVNEALIALGGETGAKLVATNDVHYVRPEDKEAQDILVSIQTGRAFDNENRLSMRADDFSLKSAQEMAEIFKDLTEAIAATQEITDAVALEIPLANILLPPFPLPDGFSPESYLEKLAADGMKKRYGPDIASRSDAEAARIRERLNYELATIQKTGFTSYFLIVADCVNWAKSKTIMVGPGRGSAAGSLVSYLLGITNVDPLKYNLLFERFLNPERIAMPDIDLDFSDRRRDEVIEYVSQKYGRERVAQIITFGTMAARAAIRDTGRALSMPYSFCDRIAKLIPFAPQGTEKTGWLKKSVELVPELKTIYQTEPEAKRLADRAMKLEGVARHASTHACGVVIAPQALTNYLPLQLATRPVSRPKAGEEESKVVVTQYEMHAVEALGLLKMDFLGLRNLTTIEDAMSRIQARYNISLDTDAVPLNDKETYRLFKEANTTGVFQFESSGMKRYLKELKPTEFEDLVSMVALYRPGPMELIPSFIARKHGKEKITYLHSKLEPILAPTYGIGVYQEQMMQIARDLAGFTLPEADTLRKAIGKKIRTLLEEQKEKLVSGMLSKGIDKKIATAIWELFPPFARYGFNRAHAVCYALIAYQTAYLKAHFPAEFMAALMTNEGSEVERVAFLVDECRGLGIKVLPPDVQSSEETFTVLSPKEIRFGLHSVKNVGANVVAAVIAARKVQGPFRSVEDFAERVRSKDLNKKSFESLVKCGALDGLAERNLLLKNLDIILEYGREAERNRRAGQESLFGSLDSQGPVAKLKLAPTEPAAKKERLAWERELLGLYLSEHPLEEYQSRLQGVTPLAELSRYTASKPVAVGGIVSGVERIITKSGAPMLFVKLEDASGKTEVLVFPRLLEKNAELWQTDKILMVKGRVSHDRDRPKILCDEAVEVF